MKVTKLEYVLLNCCKRGMLDADEAATINTAVHEQASMSAKEAVECGLGTYKRDMAIKLTTYNSLNINNHVGFDIACPYEDGE